MQTFSDS